MTTRHCEFGGPLRTRSSPLAFYRSQVFSLNCNVLLHKAEEENAARLAACASLGMFPVSMDGYHGYGTWGDC